MVGGVLFSAVELEDERNHLHKHIIALSLSHTYRGGILQAVEDGVATAAARLIIQPVWLLEKLCILMIQQYIMVVQQSSIGHGMYSRGRSGQWPSQLDASRSQSRKCANFPDL